MNNDKQKPKPMNKAQLPQRRRHYLERSNYLHGRAVVSTPVKSAQTSSVTVNEPILGKSEKVISKIIDLSNIFTVKTYITFVKNKFRPLWATRQRAAALTLAVILLVSVIQTVIQNPALAQQTPSGASGKGLLVYSDGTTTPQKRQWNFGSSAFGGEAATTTWDDVYQTVTQASPTVKDFWVTGVADNAGNLDVRTSTDGGATWTAGVTPTIGGTGTTRRFDIAFEQQSGDIVVMYSKNATTNEIGVRRYAGGSWQSEVTFDPSAISNIVTWIEITEKPGSDELAMSYLTDTTAANLGAGIWVGDENSFSGWTTSYDTTEDRLKSMVVDTANGVAYAGSGVGGIIYRCATSTGCDASGDWTVSYDTTEITIEGMTWDSANGVIYATTEGTEDLILRCATSTGCDASGDWTVSADYNFSLTQLLWDSTNGVLYVGASAGDIYRCATSTSCDASGDWTLSNDTAESAVNHLGFDKNNGVIYAGTANGGIIYRCSTSTSCDASGDWTVAYDTPETTIRAIGVDLKNGVIYAGANAIIYRCDTTTACDASGDWTTVTGLAAGSAEAFVWDSANNVMYAGWSGGGQIYRCDTTTACDASGDWIIAYDTPGTTIYSLAIDSSNSILYAGSYSDGIIYRCNLDSGCGSATSTFASAALGSCDPTTAVGDTKCFDINYETGSGRPLVNFGITAGVRFARWDGSAWSATKSVNTLADDGTMVDCDADPSSGSTEIACISISNASEDVQGWIVRYVGSGGTGCSDAAYTCVIDANSEISSHAAAAGRMFVAMTYLISGGNRRAVGVSADGGDDGGYDRLVYDGSAWTFTNIGVAQAAASVNEENILAVTNPYDRSEALIIHSDAAATTPDLWATKVTLNGSTLSTGTDVTANAALETGLANAQGRAFDMAFEPASPQTKLTQEGYIWESDDGSSGDTNTQQAAGNTAITGVRKGERLTLRTQLKNTGAGYNNDNLGLFYDRGDGIWSKVGSKTPAVTNNGTGCTNILWDCQTFESTIDKISVVTEGAKKYAAYQVLGGDNTLKIAEYVGSNGTGCASSAAWQCQAIDAPSSSIGREASMAIAQSGKKWIAYGVSGASAELSLKVAQYVGSGGTGCTATTSWTCNVVDNTIESGMDASISIDSRGTPWVTYYRSTGGNNDLWVARYVGSGGTGCGGSTVWSCEAITTTQTSYDRPIIAHDSSGSPWVAYNAGGNLEVAKHVGSAGTGCGAGGSTAWTCTLIETGATDPSLAFDPSGNAIVSYSKSSDLWIARYVGAGNGSGCSSSTEWSCTAIEVTSNILVGSTVAFDAAGQAWISYTDDTANLLKYAFNIGSNGTNCNDSSWSCQTIQTAINSNTASSIAFDDSGAAIVGIEGGKVATIRRGGEIVIAAGLAGANGDVLSESHADMTTVPNDANRDDADCLTGAASWNNGKWFESEEGSGVDLKGGSATAQCTEVSFTIDTSQAVAGRTYQFIIATDDAMRQDKGKWRGPIAVSSGAYPTLTIAADTTQRFSKDNGAKFPDCTDTAWGCGIAQDLTAEGAGDSIAMSSSGNPWTTMLGPSFSLVVAQYVGSGGNCTSTAWTCTTVDDPAAALGYFSIAFDPAGNPWVSYNDGTINALKVARFVGTGGTGCTSSAWTCTTVDDPAVNLIGQHSSIAFDPAGNAWISYHDNTALALKVAQYVGSGGNCTSTAWTCTTVDDPANTVASKSSIAFDPAGNPWVSYSNDTALALKVAQYVGSGGNCTSTAWTCTTVDDPANNVSGYGTIAFDAAGNPWISYQDSTALALKVAQYVGSGGDCTSTAWDCTTVDDPANSVNAYSSIAIDAAGNPWISYRDDTALALKVARFVGTGGDCTSTAWTCTTVDDPANTISRETSIAFDAAGNPWISYHDDTSNSLKVAKLNSSLHKPTYESKIKYPGRSAGKSDLRYALTHGKTRTSADGVCATNTDNAGYCGVYTNDGFYDSVTAQANERPMFNFAQRFDNNATLPSAYWVGRSNIAPSTAGVAGDIKIQVYRFGTTNAWEDVATNSTSSNCNTDNCALEGIPSGTLSEYFEADDANYWVYFRVWQTENTSGTETLKTDSFKAVQPQQYLRHGKHWQNEKKNPLNW